MENREDRMAAEQEKIERDLKLLGATAVEDKLQVCSVAFCTGYLNTCCASFQAVLHFVLSCVCKHLLQLQA